MRIAYFDCFAGASGDMILGSLLDAGLDIELLRKEVARLGMDGYELGVRKVVKKGISGSQALVEIPEAIGHHEHGTASGCGHGIDGASLLDSLLDTGKDADVLQSEVAGLNLAGREHGHRHSHEKVHKHDQGDLQQKDHGGHHCQSHHAHHSGAHGGHPHRNLEDIKKIIGQSSLSADIKARSISVFTRLAEAEARVHGAPVASVHFHEVGALDAIIDIVGGVSALALMGIDAVYCSPLHVGGGTVDCAHGRLPVPAPATLELVKGLPVYANEICGELLTPTGAAMLTTLSKSFGPLPAMVVEHVGYGAGQRETTIANLLRVTIGQAA